MPAGYYKVIYILCPAQVATGGPEAKHQLARALRDLGHDARMVYARPREQPRVENGRLIFPPIDDPMPAVYGQYDIPHTFEIVDTPHNTLVFPEVWPNIVRSIRQMTPYMWWLSIDHALPFLQEFGGFEAIKACKCHHLVQSYYAMGYLLERGMFSLPLFDYTKPAYLAAASLSAAGRTERILYPARGKHITDWVRRLAPNLQWQEIVGFTQEQVRELFLTSKLYVDFGHHPGKDRMPREAAILGCCVITGLRGAAANPLDIPIPRRYKILGRLRHLLRDFPTVIGTIKNTLRDYDRCIEDFAVYREIIRGEGDEFMSQVARIFGTAGGLRC